MIERPDGPAVTIVTPGYLSSTPRVVKEADALAAAGFRVRVVHVQGDLEKHRGYDMRLLANRRWRADAVRWARRGGAERRRFLHAAIRQRLASALPRALWTRTRIAELAQGRYFPELAALAARERADLFIGHYPTGLAAAAHAAQRWGVPLGFDAEDFHTGELPDLPAHRKTKDRIAHIERRYLPRCAHLTAASPGIAGAISEKYRVTRPLVVHNVFPWADRGRIDGRKKERGKGKLSVYWYSQQIGLDRGLQDVIRAVGLLDESVEIHLRGTFPEEPRRILTDLAGEAGVADRLFFHPQVSPEELLSRTAEHDVGLALEQGHTLNRAICITNKIFFYMLAGLAVAATDTPGQRTVFGPNDRIGFLYPPGDHHTLAGGLNRWLEDADALRRAKDASLAAARDRWNWESESRALVAQVESVFGREPQQATSTTAGEQLA